MPEPIFNQFPHGDLTPLSNTQRPNQLTLKTLQRELNINTLSIPSTRGNGALGHLFLTISNDAYTVAANGSVFVAPKNPGHQPYHAAGTTQHQITETNRQFKARLIKFQKFSAVCAALKKQIFHAVPSIFIAELSDDILGFVNETPLQRLAHLDTTYCAITSDLLLQNLENIQSQWTSTQLLEDLWTQIHVCYVRIYLPAYVYTYL